MKKDTSYNRRQVLTALSVAGLSFVSGSGVAAGMPSRPDQHADGTMIFGTMAALQQEASLKAEMIVQTAGYYSAGDGGAACYRILGLPREEKATEEGRIRLNNGLYALLLHAGFVNYKMFGAVGDGRNNDSVQIRAAHAYANRMNIPVININGEYWLKEVNKIEILGNVRWGSTVFHLDERYNSKEEARFEISGRMPPVTIRLNSTEKEAFLRQFGPGVKMIPALAPYKNSLVIIADKNDRIGYRAGKKFVGQSWAREELFYVEEHGRIVGDIAWKFNDYTSLTAYPADDSYLTIEGGTFYLSGDSPGVHYEGYRKNGFVIRRSRTIIRDQWVGLAPGKKDVAMDPRSGFYSFSCVYDITLENVRLVPWEQDREGTDRDVPAGTYGIGAARIMNGTFRNVTAEGSPVHWGVFGTNLNKNFRIERCTLNRVDVHFHCWNLYIRDSSIGYRGISVTGGGDLFIENTICYSRCFINFRRDFGSRWDGHIRLRNCRFIPAIPGETSVLEFNPMDFDYKYPIGFGRTIKMDDLIIDFSAQPDSTSPCWLVKVPDFSVMKHGGRLFFPYDAAFRNILVEGREKGVRLVETADPGMYDIGKKGSYNGSRLSSNSRWLFEHIQLERLDPAEISAGSPLHIRLGKGKKTGQQDPFSLYPEIVFVDCKDIAGDLDGNAADVSFERCTIHQWQGSREGELPGRLSFSACLFQPRVRDTDKVFYYLAAELGTSFTNCTLHAPEAGGLPRPEWMDRYGFIQINGIVRYNHLNTRLGNEIADHYSKKGIRFTREFISMLKNNYEGKNIS